MSTSKRFLLIASLLMFVLCITSGGIAMASESKDAGNDSQISSEYAEDLGWQLSVQAYSFRMFTFFEAIDKAASMGIKNIEAYSKQHVSADEPKDVTTHFTMSDATKAKIKKKLDSAGVKLVAYGVISGKNDEEWRQIFEFAKDMGIQTLTSEPAPEFMDLVESLCEEYKINVAIHNHPAPSRYWNPEAVLEAVKGRSKRIGSCADIGHWLRSGLDPLECVKKLEGRIVSSHFKDLNKKEAPNTDKKDRTAHDVPWGTGVANVFGILEEFKRQGMTGVFSAEYEHNWENSVPEIKQSADYFYMAAAALSDKDYGPLFNKKLSNAKFPKGSWVLENGVLAAKDKGDIWSKKRYGDFALDLEFKCAGDTNSGVFIRCDDTVEWLHTSMEVQIQQKVSENGKHNCGGVFDCLAPSKVMTKPAGQWNHYTIIANDNKIDVVLNGEQVLDMDLDLWTEAGKNPDGTKNKFKTAYKDMLREGHVGLQYHGHPVWFRNMTIKELKK